MRFFTVIVTSMVLALSVSAAPSILQPRALTAKQMVDNINIITNMSAQLQPIVQNIRLSPFEKRQFNSFQPVIKGFQSIIQVAQKDNQAMQGTEPYGDDDAQLVCEAFRGVSDNSRPNINGPFFEPVPFFFFFYHPFSLSGFINNCSTSSLANLVFSNPSFWVQWLLFFVPWKL